MKRLIFLTSLFVSYTALSNPVAKCSYKNNRKFSVQVSSVSVSKYYDEYYHVGGSVISIGSDAPSSKLYDCELEFAETHEMTCKFRNNRTRVIEVDSITFGIAEYTSYEDWTPFTEKKTYLLVNGHPIDGILHSYKNADCTMELD